MPIKVEIKRLIFLILFLCASASSFAGDKQSIKAIVFSDFTIFDPAEVTEIANGLLPGHGDKVIEILFDYQMLGATDGLQDLISRTEASLVFVSEQMHFALPVQKRKIFLSALMNLKTWPDANESIKQLSKMPVTLVLLSNMEEKMLSHQLKQEKLDKEFTSLLSADDTDTQKPDPAAYALVINKLHLPKESILFVTDADWDAAVAKDYGYPIFWINRTDKKSTLLANTKATGKDLKSLLKFVTEQNTAQ